MFLNRRDHHGGDDDQQRIGALGRMPRHEDLADLNEQKHRKTDRGGQDAAERRSAEEIDDTSVEEELLTSKDYKIKKQEVYKAKKDFGILDALFWALQSKDKKLSVLLKGITPEDFEENIIEGKINEIFIKKIKRTVKGSNEQK